MWEGNVFSLVSVSLLTEAWADLHVTTTHDAPAPPSLTIRGPPNPSPWTRSLRPYHTASQDQLESRRLAFD